VAVKKVFEKMKDAGIAEKTLRRAKCDLGVVAEKDGMEAGGTGRFPEGQVGTL